MSRSCGGSQGPLCGGSESTSRKTQLSAFLPTACKMLVRSRRLALPPGSLRRLPPAYRTASTFGADPIPANLRAAVEPSEVRPDERKRKEAYLYFDSVFPVSGEAAGAGRLRAGADRVVRRTDSDRTLGYRELRRWTQRGLELTQRNALRDTSSLRLRRRCAPLPLPS